MSAIKLPDLEPVWPVPSAILALLTCVSISSTSLVFFLSQPGRAGFLQLLALLPGAMDKYPCPGSQPASQPHAITCHHWLERRRGPELPSLPLSVQGELPSRLGSAPDLCRKVSRRGCYWQSIGPVPLPNPYLGWGETEPETACVPTCPFRASGVKRARPGPFLNHPLLPSPP